MSGHAEQAGSSVTARKHWDETLSRLRDDGHGYACHQLSQVLPLSWDAGVFTLGVDDLYFRDWLSDHFGELTTRTLAGVVGTGVLLAWQKVEGPIPRAMIPSGPKVTSSRRPAQLDGRYTFESYVISDSNQLPAAAAMAVADSPGRAYNPLFIYGGTGLGKTHLLHAVGSRIIARNPDARVVYLSSEEFTNQFIESVRDQKMTEFRRRFRDECDVLLIDDIQFLGRKQETQNEFFYTFNTLHQAAKAVVMTSDTVPSEIPGLEERLRSRFAMGLITDVQEPNFEARVAILKKKAQADRVNLTDKVAHFIARVVVSNVRELEGALIKVTASHALTGQPLTEELCALVLKDIVPKSVALDAETIQREVARYYHLAVDELKGERRVRNVAHARQVAMYLCRTLTSASLPEIGRKFNKDHSTVHTSVRKIEQARASNAQLVLDLGELTKKLGPA